MGKYKNVSGHPLSIPVFGLNVGWDAEKNTGETFEVPDEFDGQFDVNPAFESTRVKTPDVTPDPTVTAAMTGPVPVVGAPDQIPA